MTFKNKQEFIDFVEHQLDIKLENDKTLKSNKKRNVLYTFLDENRMTLLNSFFHKYNIRVEKHLNGFYWIWVK